MRRFVLILLLLFVPLNASAQQPDLLTGLVSFWSLEETSGPRADATGGEDLTDVNTVTYATGLVGNAAKFTAANIERLTSTSTNLAAGGESFTVCGWFNVIASVSADEYLAMRKSGVGALFDFKLFYDDSNTKLILKTSDGTNQTTLTPSFTASLGTYYFVCGYFDKSSLEIGLIINDNTAITDSVLGIYDNDSGTFSLGAYDTGTLASTSEIDQVGYWNIPLSLTQINWLYNSGFGRSYDEILATASAATYQTILPSGGLGSIEMSATAGDIAITVSLLILSSIVLFDVLRQIAHLTAKK